MLVISKKRILVILSGVMVAIFIFCFTCKTDQNEYISTVSLPVSGKVVVVDAGHRYS